MTDLTKPLSLVLALGLTASTAFAQDSATPDAPAAQAPAAEAPAPADDAAQATSGETPAADTNTPTEDGPGTTYEGETFGDWGLQCMRTEGGTDPCQMYQLLKDQNGNSIADISLFPLPEGGQAVTGATVMVPLETLLTQNLVMQVDSSEPRIYPYTFCARNGCYARIGLTAAELAGLKRGNKATLTLVPVQAPDQKVTATVSLTGFTAAYDAVTASAAK
ncbi:invasion associated locus B family protein [Thioclava sp. SK-1]|uniref:invasion associated locus B family protein n=1 Tax=Thioclava sp. SK-1 TaxID=1889770 RepID=UPI000826461E|nr:invasion associated locus B family protein [Thioclava sp. SK-1]OCX63111.1 invasion associated locus B family protein [Thioclava sp. SK-1]